MPNKQQGWAGGEGEKFDTSDVPKRLPPAEPGLYAVTIGGVEEVRLSKPKEGKTPRPQAVLNVTLNGRITGDSLANIGAKAGRVRDYVTFDKGTPMCAIKVRQIKDAFDKEDPEDLTYDSIRSWADELVNCDAFAVVKLGKPREEGGDRYPEIRDYLTQEEAQAYLDKQAAKDAGATAPSEQAPQGRRGRRAA